MTGSGTEAAGSGPRHPQQGLGLGLLSVVAAGRMVGSLGRWAPSGY